MGLQLSLPIYLITYIVGSTYHPKYCWVDTPHPVVIGQRPTAVLPDTTCSTKVGHLLANYPTLPISTYPLMSEDLLGSLLLLVSY